MENGSMQIVIGQRGWVWVGCVSREGDYLLLSNSTTIVRWGAAGSGIETLAVKGPQPETRLGGPGVNRRVHVLAVIDLIEVTEGAAARWKAKLK